MGFCRSIKANVRAALRLSPHKRWALWQAWLYLLVCDLGLRALPFGRVRSWAASAAMSAPPHPKGKVWPTIEEWQRLVGIA
jgi:hypothetical protein